ncbi:hypothetical protein I203_107283 [Kwoniella mangroviensis CBS 8507]|uniref:hypothetical protein n=1 Tax=Kwoniella mangroviensis CBS 8507 TaxID=1296122 RepID=UPI00305F0C51
MPLIDARRLRRPRLLVLLLLALLGLIAVTHRRSENWTETEISIEEAEYRHSSLGWCDVAPDLCAEFGEIELRKVMNYEGSGHGLARFLAKARQGQGFTVGALGGSGSDYFAMCFGHHIPEDVDLVLVDMAINDGFSEKGAESYETLLRHLLALPNRPAVINLQVFALMFQTIATGGDIHQGISSYYDVPTVSLRNLLLPIILQNSSYGISYFDHPPGTTELDREGLGTRHISAKGHGLIGRLTNAFIDMRIRDLVTGLYGAELESRLVPETPRIRALQRFNTYEAIPAIPPKCLSAHSRSPTLIPSTNKGWRELISGDKKYLIADQPGSIVSFDFVTAGGLVQLSVYRSHNAGLGTAACWVDDMKDKRVIIEARWDDLVSIGYTVTIANDLEDGDHVLTCDLLEETKDPQKKHEFRIIAVIR